jgi:hypothetical protein
VPAGNDEPAAFLCESQGRRSADACQRAGDQDNLMFHHYSSGTLLHGSPAAGG